MPGLPDVAETEALEAKMNSYGKTWHTWMTGMHERQADALPFGAPRLQWSFNRDGEAFPGMVTDRDARTGLNTTDTKKRRADLVSLARPQGGVNAMERRFDNATSVPGVIDNGDPTTRQVPTFVMKESQASQ